MTDAIKAYDHEYYQDHKNILDFIKSEGSLTTNNPLVNEIFEHALQLTAYEKNGCITDTDFYFYLAAESEPATVAMHNAWCDENNYPDSYIYSMDEFNDIMHGTEPYEISRMVWNGTFSPNDDYFSFDGYGNLQSTDYYGLRDYFSENEDDIKEYFIENNNLEYFSDEDRETIETAMEYKDIIIDTALYMVSLGY